MSLQAMQRAMVRVCLSREPAESDLAALGERKRWLLYREMVRDRLADIVAKGLPRTREALGDAFAQWVTRWLAEEPPRTHFFREVVERFADFAVPRLREDPQVPPFVADLATFERAVWEVGYLPRAGSAACEFDFEKPVALTTALRLIRLGHAVHESGTGTGTGTAAAAPPGDVRIAVYRKPDAQVASWRTINDLTAAILEEWTKGGSTASEAVRRVAAARGVAIDRKFLEGLGTIVAELIESGVILGTRSHDTTS